MRKFFLLLILMAALKAEAQNIDQVLKQSYSRLVADPDLKHATISLYVVNASTGAPVFAENIQTGLASASTLKVITSATAYGILGNMYTWKTTLAYTGTIENGVLNGDIIIKGSGDPTLGSWRYEATKEEAIIDEFKNAIAKAGIQKITGKVIADESSWNSEITPDGWAWQDIGNYYGAGARALNWRENQYDLYLKSGNTSGSGVEIAGTKPPFVYGLKLRSELTAAAKGSGDNAYIYHQLLEPWGFVRGTIPIGENKFTISGSMPNGAQQLAITLEAAIKNQTPEEVALQVKPVQTASKPVVFYTHNSPELSKVSYWFLNKSINLYGEAILKTLAVEKAQSSEIRAGVKTIQNFWKNQGIDAYSLNIQDGSGLSPGNRITTESLVKVLLYTSKQSWFSSYYDGFPVIHGIRMKSGSINGVVGYTGFVRNKKGEEFAFAFLVNNYNGSGSSMRRKMWNLLDILK